jgi:hypothetical protein
MNEDRRGSWSASPEAYEGVTTPAPDEYGRVTNPERFASLHQFAAELLESLGREFDVERSERHGLDSELESDATMTRPTVRLRPADRAAAPIVVAFSGFPGLRVRFGLWCMMAFPDCGCDACNETAEGEAARLKSFIDDVIEGRFREAIQLSAPDSWVEWEFWSARGRSHSKSQLDREKARQFLADSGRSSYDWKPWLRRRGGTHMADTASSG